jgi:nickel-type superoxide dismutase maturation protease
MPDGGRWQGYDGDGADEGTPGTGSGRGRRPLLPFGIADVAGPSMVPTLLPGDRLVVRYGAGVRPGAIVVLRHPMQQDLLIVKRAVERRGGGWWVLGDNTFVENDSREFGVVPDEFVLARALVRLRPPSVVKERGQLSPVALVSWAVAAVRPLRPGPRGASSGRSVPRRLRAR